MVEQQRRRMGWYPRRVPGGSDAVPIGPGGADRRHSILNVAAVASMWRWLTSAAAVSAGQDQRLCRLGPTEKAAARPDLGLGRPIVDLDLLFLAVRLGRSVRPRGLYHRWQDLLCRHRRVKEMPVLHSAAAEPERVCACHCHSQVGRPPAPAPSA